MTRRNVVTSVAVGAGILAVLYVLGKKDKLSLRSFSNEADNLVNRIKSRFGSSTNDNSDSGFGNAHDGQHLANKIRQKVQRNLTN